PVCVGFWWALHRTDAGHSYRNASFFQGAQTVLIPGAIIMAACPIISTSRGGALVALIETGMVAAVFFFAYRRSGWRTKVNIALALSCVLAVAGYWGWQPLRARLKTMSSDDPSGRAQIFENARRIAIDFPVFGSGPGTFGSIYHLYRKSQDQEW